MKMELDTTFIITNRKEIKNLLTAFCWRYERLSDEQKTATKKWLDALVVLQNTPPSRSFRPKIILRTHFPIDEGEWSDWSFPARLLIVAIRAMEQKIKYVISDDDAMDWDV